MASNYDVEISKETIQIFRRHMLIKDMCDYLSGIEYHVDDCHMSIDNNLIKKIVVSIDGKFIVGNDFVVHYDNDGGITFYM